MGVNQGPFNLNYKSHTTFKARIHSKLIYNTGLLWVVSSWFDERTIPRQANQQPVYLQKCDLYVFIFPNGSKLSEWAYLDNLITSSGRSIH